MYKFKVKGRQTEYQNSIKKFLEPSKDPLKRLKSLKHGLEKSSAEEIKEFYSEYSSTIFFVVYSSFTTVETAIQERVERGKGYNDLHLKELLEVVLPALSRVLVTLPELIKKRWQFNSICLIIRKLLHPENNIKLRQYGIKLLTLWVQGLQENAGDACMEIFASAVPHFPPEKTPMGLPMSTNSTHSPAVATPSSSTSSLCERYGTYSSTSLGRQDSSAPLLKNSSSVLSGASPSRGDVICQSIIYPLSPGPSIDDTDLTLELMDHLLRCLTSTVDRLHWNDPSQYLRGFSFLFFLFKLFYLACLYKEFRTGAGLYTPTPPPDIKFPATTCETSHEQLQSVQEEPSDTSSSVVPPPQSASNYKRKRVQNPYRLSSVIKLEFDLSHPVYSKIKNLVLKYVLMWVLPSNQSGRNSEPRIPGSPAPSPISLQSKFTISGVELMRDMWFTSRDNVSLLLEVCRQGFDTPLSEPIKLKKLIELYYYWQQETLKAPELQPPFMLSPPVQSTGETTTQLSTEATVTNSQEGSDPRAQFPGSELTLVHSSVVLSWEQLSGYEGFKPLPVQAGLQATLKMIIAHTSQVFLKESKNREELKSQCELCRTIIRLYQDITVHWSMDHETWEYMLAVLLYMTQELLSGGPPYELESTLGGNLAGSLLKTLLVCYLRASMTIEVSSCLWDNLRLVLSSLTQWKEVVVQWKHVMDSMLVILGQYVYGLNLKDLPLDRLQFEDQKRLHQRLRLKSNAEDRIPASRMASFSVINIQPPGSTRRGGSGLSHTPPARMHKHYTTTPELTPKKNFPKAKSIDCGGTGNPAAPDDVKYVKRHSVPAQHAPNSSPSLPSVPETIAEDSDPDSSPPSHSPKVTHTPKRSTSSVADYYRNKEVDTLNKTPVDDDVNPSPGAQSLPPEALFKIEMNESSDRVGPSPTTTTPHQELGEIKEISGSDVFVNPNTLSPSPEPERKNFDKFHSGLEDGKSAKSAVEKQGTPEHSLSENEKPVKHKESSLKKYRFRWQSHYQPLKTKQQKGKSDVAPNDLVLKNENPRDSLTLTGEEVDKLQQGRPTRSDSDSSDLHSKSEPFSLTKSVFVPSPTAEPEPQLPRFRLLHKSSSEGNLPNLIDSVELKDSSSGYTPPAQFKNSRTSDQHLLLRRVVSSGGGSPPSSVTREVCVPDPFSSDIIPTTTREGVITPPAQSPARPSYNQRKPLMKAVSIASDGCSSMDSPIDELLEDRRGSGTKSPPALVVSHTSPTPPLSPPGIQQSHGWDPVISASVWLRMLRILGNINDIKNPYIHAEAMTCLQGIWKALVDFSDNSGISLDSQKAPPLPEFMPPLSILTNWVIKACSLPPKYSTGRMRAYQLLCEMFIRHWHTQASQDHLVHFYSLLHEALQPSSELLHVAIRCCCKLFSHGLPGSTILLTDCVQACSKILSIQSGGPRNDALFLLGSLLYIPDLYSDVALPSVDSSGEVVCPGVRGEELKEKLVNVLFHAAVKEPTRISRCIALYQIGILAYSELCSGHPCRRLPEGIDILLANLQFADRGVAMCAIDMISLLCQVAPQMQRLYPSMPTRVVEALCYAIAVFLTDELEKVAWVDKVIVTLIHCLRDWVMVLSPCDQAAEGCLDEHTIKSVFEVLQAAAGSNKHHAISQLFTIRNPTNIELEQLETSSSRSPHGHLARSSQDNASRRKSGVDVQLSSEQLAVSGSGVVVDGDRIQTAARSILTHLLNLFGHFPFGCGAAQMTSNVMEYHDCPSLQHMDELSTEIYDSPRLQFFSFNDRAVVTFVEIPAKLDAVPSKVKTGNFQTRLIVRDVTGKYTWDCTVLYGQEPATTQSDSPSLLSKASSMDSLSESLETAVPELVTLPDVGLPSSSDPLQPPFWREYLNSDRDVLQDLLMHIETTSPECVLYPEQVGLCEPVPVKSGGVMDDEEGMGAVEERMLRLLTQQDHKEKQYIKEAFNLPSMQGEKASAPRHFPNILAFHHCRVFLSHLGMFSWNKRSHLDLLEKNNQLILELKHLDSIQAQCRQTYKVAVLYVAPGQEDKKSILLNNRGSKEYEEFVAGLGWEVDMQTHSGYMGGLKREFCANCTLPYYATSSEEVLFHVSTRLSSKIEQKVRHLGNDEVHIVWSEHWRDYRRTIFRTQFADVLIIVYPLPNGLFRIQINKKPNVPQFGPLFDGALIDRSTLSPLVRATALNALRAQRTPLIGYRGRYEERLKYIQTITSKKLTSSYEHFAQNVMHPLETSNTQLAPSMPTVASLRSSPMKPPTSLSSSSLPTFTGTHAHSHTTSTSTVASSHHHSSVRPHLPHLPDTPPKFVASFLKLPSKAFESARRSSTPSPPMRPRSSTNDESMLKPPKSPSMSRNSSVPDNLSELGVSRSNTNYNNNSTPSIPISQVKDYGNKSASYTGISSSSTL